jgi:hypothetical protein
MNKPLRHKTSRKPAQRAVYRITGYTLNPQIPYSMLSPKQREILSFALKFHKANQRFPSLKEICEGKIGGHLVANSERNSRSNVAEILDRLVAYGYLGRCVKSGYNCWLTVEETKMAIEYQDRFKSKHGKSSF